MENFNLCSMLLHISQLCMIFQDLGKAVYGAVVLSKDKNLSQVLNRKYTSIPLCKEKRKTQDMSARIQLLWLIALKRYTNTDLKISLYIWVHIKTIPWKFRFLNPNNSRIICP